MKKFKYVDIKTAENIISDIRGDAVEQFFVAKEETNVSKQIKCLDLVAACDDLLKTLKHIKTGFDVVKQLNK